MSEENEGILLFIYPLLRICLLILEREGGKWEGRRERNRNIDVREKYWSVASSTLPDRGLDLQLFGVLDDAPTIWATEPAF